MIPFTAGMATYQTSDTRAGCPAKARANTPLLKKTFNVTVASLITCTGHMIRSAAGRADLRLYAGPQKNRNTHVFLTHVLLHGLIFRPQTLEPRLYVDGARKDDGLTYTPTKQWADASVYWSGVVGPGTHSAWLLSPQARSTSNPCHCPPILPLVLPSCNWSPC